MRILVVTLRYPPYVAGGYELLTFDAVEALRARGHEVDVLCGRGRALEGVAGVHPHLEPALPEPGEEANLFRLSHEGSNTDRLRLHFLRSANQRATTAALSRTGAELLLFFNLGLVSLAPVLAARRSKIPTLGYVTDPWPLNHWLNDWRAAVGANKPLKLSLLERAWRFFRRRVDLGALCVSSTYMGAQLTADGIPAKDIQRLPIPLSRRMAPDPPLTAPPDRADGDPLRVVSLSMLWEGKGIHVLLAAAAQACRQGADLRLEIAGEGAGDEYKQTLERLAAAPALSGRVQFHGMLDRAGADRLLASSHVLCLPSIWGEPFPMATIEAMARGLALIATDAGGTPEQVNDGSEGLIVPAADAKAMAQALVRLDSDDALRCRMGAAALSRIDRDFSMEAFTDGLEQAALESVRQGTR